VLTWAVEEAEGNVAIRLAIGPSPRRIELPGGYRLAPGRGSVLRDGQDVLVFAYGPVMLHEALTAAEILSEHEHDAAVVDMPWLNRFDRVWLDELTASSAPIVVIDDHAPIGGLGDALRRELPGREVTVCGVDGWPAFGTPPEALRAHGLDGVSLAGRIAEARKLARA
jgi:transketolase